MEFALLMDTALVGEDTDLLILLCYYADLDYYNIFFRPEPKKNVKKQNLEHTCCYSIIGSQNL